MENQVKRVFREDIKRTMVYHAVIPILIIAIVFVVLLVLIWKQSITSQNEDAMYALHSKLDNIVENYKSVSEEIIEHSDWSWLEEGDPFSDDFSRTVYKALNKLPEDANAFLFTGDQELVFSTTQDLPQFIRQKPEVDWGIFKKMGSEYAQPVADIFFTRLGESDENELLVGQAIGGKEKTGYLVFHISNESISSYIQNLPMQIVITDRFNRSIMNSSREFLNEDNKINGVFRQATGNIEFNGQRFFVNHMEAVQGKFRIYLMKNIDDLYMTVKMIGILIFVVLATLIAGSIYSAFVMAEKKTKTIEELVSAFESVQKGELDNHLNISTQDEFEIIANAYNLMLDSIKGLIHRNQIQARETVVAQVKHLEAQFNPHFLFNTLENVRFMVRLDPKAAEKMIVSLSNLLRYSIENTTDLVCIRDELEYTKPFLTILSYRFGERFGFQLYVDEETMDCRVPKLVFQPLIENAVKYGFGDRENLFVKLKTYTDGEFLMVEVYDDGIGISQKLLDSLRSNLDRDCNKTNHIGLYNLNQRIALVYGKEYGLEIDSALGSGTRVKVKLPILHKGNEC